MAERIRFASDRVTAQVAEQLQKSDIVYPGNWETIEGLSRFRDDVLGLKSVDRIFMQIDHNSRRGKVVIVGKLPQILSTDIPLSSGKPVKSTLGPSTETNDLLRITNAHLRLALALKGTGIGSVFLSIHNKSNAKRITIKKLSELFLRVTRVLSIQPQRNKGNLN